MSKIGFVADIHIHNHRRFGGESVSGINRRCGQAISTLEIAVKRAKALGCENLVILGDLFDTNRPDPQVIAAVQSVLTEPTIILKGNHDMVSTMPGDHTLGPLSPVATIVEEPSVITDLGLFDLVCVPFQPGPAKDWLPKVLKTLLGEKKKEGPARVKIMALHLGLASQDTAAFLKDSHDQISTVELGELCNTHGIDAVFAGNWHSHAFFRSANKYFTRLVQVGSLCPTGWDNPGLEGYGKLVVFDSAERGDKQIIVETIPGPRFLNVDRQVHGDSSEMFNAIKLREDTGSWKLYVRLLTPPDLVASQTAFLEEQKERKIFEDGEVVVDSSHARVAARTAATSAKSAETLDEAIASYISSMPLEPSVDRQSVIALTKKYLFAA